MARPHDYSTLPAHPAVGSHYKTAKKYGWTTVVADVTCPQCGKVRTYALYTLRQLMQKPHFDGKCFKCGHKASRASTAAALRKKFAGKSRMTVTGYVAIARSAIPEADLAMFDAMRSAGAFVTEHRWNMAKALGRPLRSNECVDHMDGVKTNNDPSNLRIYLKGKNQPGSLNGYGTYYHEWQMAEARNRLLMAELEKLRNQ